MQRSPNNSTASRTAPTARDGSRRASSERLPGKSLSRCVHYAIRHNGGDFIVPIRSGAGTNLTRSSAYKLWRKACDEAGVVSHSLHSTRHTFTTSARRGTPRTDAVDAITHNKRGEMVDYHNHWLWTPLCEAMEALSYAADSDEKHPLAPPSGGGAGGGVKAKPQAESSENCPNHCQARVTI